MMIRSKILDHSMLHSGVKTGCQCKFRFRSYGGKTFAIFQKYIFLVTEGAQIADDGQKQNCRTPRLAFGSENRMSIPLPVPELWRENLSGFSKIDFFVTKGA
jgi:hypothetical protein